MVSEAFDLILREVGEALEIEDLRLDETNTCLIRFKNGFEVYLEPHEAGEEMLILTELAELPPGRFREDVMKEALIANGYPYPRHGTFAFSDQGNKLILFKLLPLKNLTGERVASYLGTFMNRAIGWKETLDRGEVPLASTLATATGQAAARPSGMFGGLVP